MAGSGTDSIGTYVYRDRNGHPQERPEMMSVKKAKHNSGNSLIAIGCLMILSAAFITAYNINASNNAGRASKETFERFVEQVRIEPVKDEPYDVVAEYGLPEEIRGYLVNKPKENKEDPVFDIDGIEYTGTGYRTSGKK